MGEIELDGGTAARLKVDEQRAIPRAEHISWMRLAVEPLLPGDSSELATTCCAHRPSSQPSPPGRDACPDTEKAKLAERPNDHTEQGQETLEEAHRQVLTIPPGGLAAYR
jgi:hypothetical protein